MRELVVGDGWMSWRYLLLCYLTQSELECSELLGNMQHPGTRKGQCTSQQGCFLKHLGLPRQGQNRGPNLGGLPASSGVTKVPKCCLCGGSHGGGGSRSHQLLSNLFSVIAFLLQVSAWWEFPVRMTRWVVAMDKLIVLGVRPGNPGIWEALPRPLAQDSHPEKGGGRGRASS